MRGSVHSWWAQVFRVGTRVGSPRDANPGGPFLPEGAQPSGVSETQCKPATTPLATAAPHVFAGSPDSQRPCTSRGALQSWVQSPRLSQAAQHKGGGLGPPRAPGVQGAGPGGVTAGGPASQPPLLRVDPAGLALGTVSPVEGRPPLGHHSQARRRFPPALGSCGGAHRKDRAPAGRASPAQEARGGSG